MYRYSLYGFIAESNTEFPQLLVCNEPGEAQITIDISEGTSLREKYKSILEEGRINFFTEYGVWFHNQAGDFLVETMGDKTRMVCEKFEDTDVRIARSFLLGNCIALAMTQRKKIVLHGSTVAMGDKTVLVCGDSGTGKSTTSMALLDGGNKLLADDISVLDVEKDGLVYSYPGFPEQKLCRDAAVDNGFDLDELTYIDEDRDKFSVDRRDIFLTEKRKVDAMVSLHLVRPEGADDEYVNGVRLKLIDGAEKVNAITSRFFLDWLYGYGLGLAPEEMLKCVSMAGQINIIDVTRIKGAETKKEIVDRILENI